MSDLFAELSAVEQHARYAAGEVSPVEVTEAALARIEAAEPVLHAMQISWPERARAAARASADRWAAGRPLGRLDGVTVTIKDNVDVAGEPTRWGTAASPDQPATRTAPVAERLFAAGAVVLGKTTMPDWGMLSSGISSVHPTTRNAWNADWNAGGSSSGAGAATAAGYAPINLGSDIGGSIRLPAGWNGCLGYKPSFGRIPVDPAYIGRTIGPLTRTVADAALTMAALSGPDERDPYSLPAQPIDWNDLELRPAGLRIGLLTEAGTGTAVSPAVRDAVLAAADVFAAAGADVRPLEPFLTADLLERVDRFWRVGHWNDYLAIPAERRDLLLPFIADWSRAGAELTGPEATAGSDAQLQIAKVALAATAGVDLVLSPVSPEPTYPADWPMPSNDVEHAMDHIGFCMPYNMSGQPAISINCGYTDDARPIGLQIAGRRFDDRTVLAAASFYSDHGPADSRRPWPKIW
ncbi:amidase [Microlunatus soli]|uniref:Aspartyl-tRNA(Asn)/glutamyl-tRNA(Gln) amidotransferase subunit A n=1 Tax=Microlunatus soli TaxID=630515 RepID=A0A1H2AQ09_9ACTN|nr:amidase [Microlunatus soli]SDT47899.1 aspartyl-tRNA(Asn)/glutamyl-tRNA(Gln) amidotransferase subunit A [Microlunatus soli]